MIQMLREFRTAMLLLVALTVVTGGVYPAVVTLVARVAFPHAAAGSLIDASALGGPLLSASHFPVVFAVIGLVAVSSAAIFWWQLPVGAGAGLVRGSPASVKGRGP